MSDEKTELHVITEVLTQGLSELREDNQRQNLKTEKLEGAVTDMLIAHKEFMAEQSGYNKELSIFRSEIYGKDGGILTRIGTLEIAQSNDKLRWGLVATVATMLITGCAGFWALVVKPFQDAQISNTKVAEKLDSQNQNLDDIFKLLAEEYQKREAAGMYETTN